MTYYKVYIKNQKRPIVTVSHERAMNVYRDATLAGHAAIVLPCVRKAVV
jgi:hypothetical protein